MRYIGAMTASRRRTRLSHHALAPVHRPRGARVGVQARGVHRLLRARRMDGLSLGRRASCRPKPVTDILRETGDWALRFLVASLAVTPLRHATRWNRVYTVRRMLGLTALFYTLAHLGFWFGHENFRWLHILYEAFFRTYLVIGVIATAIMAILGLTSNDASVKRLGAAGWNRLHWWVYPAALASLVHYFMLVRLDATQAALMAGLCTLFAGFRFLRKVKVDFGVLDLLALALSPRSRRRPSRSAITRSRQALTQAVSSARIWISRIRCAPRGGCWRRGCSWRSRALCVMCWGGRAGARGRSRKKRPKPASFENARPRPSPSKTGTARRP